MLDTRALVAAALALAVAALLWGSSFFFIHHALAGFDPWTTTFVRCLVGGLVVGAAATVLEPRAGRSVAPVPSVSRAAHRSTVIAGLCTAGALLGVALGQQSVSSSVAGIVLGTVPVWTTAIVVLRSGSQGTVTVGLLAGITLGAVAAIAPAFGSAEHVASVAGLVLLLGASMCHGSSMVAVVGAVQRFGPMRATSLVMLVAAAALAIPMLTFGGMPHPDRTAVLSLAEVALLPTGIAYIAFFRAVAALGPARASVAIYLIPAVAVLVGTIVGGEPMHIGSAIGAAAAMAAVAVTVLDTRRETIRGRVRSTD